jgi:acyl-CoA synthetase
MSYDPHYVYIGTLAGCFLCVDAVSGQIKWFKRLEKPIFSTPFIRGDSVFVATVNGCLKCLNHSGEELWELRTDVPVFSSPVGITSQKISIAGDVFLASHGHKVYCVSSDGKYKWSTSVDGPVYATPCFISLTKQETSTPLPLHSDSVYIVVATTKGTMYFLAASDGMILKTLVLPGEVFSSPVTVGRDIVLGCRNDYLYCVKLVG